ncbi:hypothetical protein ACTA71_011570 [Dictyostelium dimigraforme]
MWIQQFNNVGSDTYKEKEKEKEEEIGRVGDYSLNFASINKFLQCWYAFTIIVNSRKDETKPFKKWRTFKGTGGNDSTYNNIQQHSTTYTTTYNNIKHTITAFNNGIQ